jgi:hypothetical protein
MSLAFLLLGCSNNEKFVELSSKLTNGKIDSLVIYGGYPATTNVLTGDKLEDVAKYFTLTNLQPKSVWAKRQFHYSLFFKQGTQKVVSIFYLGENIYEWEERYFSLKAPMPTNPPLLK